MNARQRSRRRAELAYAAAMAVGPGQSVDENAPLEDVPLLSTQEIESIRWAGYDTAIADAIAHRDRALDSAVERLDKVTRGAYLEYGRALDAADATFAAARRAAMHAHELTQAGQAAP